MIGARDAFIFWRRVAAPVGLSTMEEAMFTIDIDEKTLEAVKHRVDHMLQSIEHLKRTDLGNELADWQVEDMGRNRPFVMRWRRQGRAVTIVRPHSLKQVRRSIAYQRSGGRRIARLLARTTKRGFLKAQAAFHSFQPITSQRPYLRDELLEKLVTRLGEMAAEKLKW
jgi:hypothetical protein